MRSCQRPRPPARRGAAHRVMRMTVESAEFTLKGETVATAFFANQCEGREMTQFASMRGFHDRAGRGSEDGCCRRRGRAQEARTSFMGWCQRGPPDLALEGGKPQIVGDVAYGAARNLSSFACDDGLRDVDMDEAAAAEGPARASWSGTTRRSRKRTRRRRRAAHRRGSSTGRRRRDSSAAFK